MMTTRCVKFDLYSSMLRKTISLLLISLSLALLPMAVSKAQDLATAIEAYKWFDNVADIGGISCLNHLGSDQCRSPDRCAKVLGYVVALKSGLPSAAEDLAEKMGSSSMNRNCGYSLLGGNTTALFRNFEYLANFAREHGSRADHILRDGVKASGKSISIKGGPIFVAGTAKYTIQNVYHSNRNNPSYLDVHPNSHTDLYLDASANGQGRWWQLHDHPQIDGKRVVSIRNVYHGSNGNYSFLDVHPNSNKDLYLDALDTGEGRWWILTPHGQDTFSLQNVYHSKRNNPSYLDVHPDKNTDLYLDASDGGEGRWWIIKQVQ